MPTVELENTFTTFQWILGCLHVVAALSLGIYAEVEDKDWKTDVFTEYNAWVGLKNKTCATGGGCFIYTIREKFGTSQLSLIWATASFSLISGFHHLFAAYMGKKYIKKYVYTGVNIPRWIDYAGSSALMFSIISILFTSPPTITVLVLSYVSQFLVVVAGAGSDVALAVNVNLKRGYSKLIFWATAVAYFFPWLFLIIQYETAVNAQPKEDACGVKFQPGTEKKDPPAFVSAAVWGLFVTFSLFAITQGIKIYKTSLPVTEANMLKYEFWFSFLSFLSKIPLLGNIASGIIGRSENIKNAPSGLNQTLSFESDNDDLTVFWRLLIISLSVSALIGIIMLGSAYKIGFAFTDFYRTPKPDYTTLSILPPPYSFYSVSQRNVGAGQRDSRKSQTTNIPKLRF